jgi:hypothetical protein
LAGVHHTKHTSHTKHTRLQTHHTRGSHTHTQTAPPGTSHEWNGVADLASDPNSAASFANIFSSLGRSPLLRIGGHSQETLKANPSAKTWQALAALRDRTGARFVIGLPLEGQGAVKMAKEMMASAERWLGDSVIMFELGNEPGESSVRFRVGRVPGWSGWMGVVFVV